MGWWATAAALVVGMMAEADWAVVESVGSAAAAAEAVATADRPTGQQAARWVGEGTVAGKTERVPEEKALAIGGVRAAGWEEAVAVH